MQKGKNRLQNFHLHDKICKLDKTSGKESKKRRLNLCKMNKTNNIDPVVIFL